jgi:AmmeMemoRadiSam system protein B
MKNRVMSVAGTFYPAQCSEINRYIDTFSKAVKTETTKVLARAIISPHAGYVYSGFTANAAYGLIDTHKIKRVIVIGPSHRVYLNGASVALYENYQTPCADLKMDLEYSRKLIDKYDVLSFDPAAHAEHSTETQVPFIGHYFNDVSLVEIVYGDLDYKSLIPVIESVMKDEENFVVISTDLSHFYTLEEANKLDNICLKAGGMIGVKAVLQASKNQGLKTKLVDYRTSYDASSDATRVVGYMSALIG